MTTLTMQNGKLDIRATQGKTWRIHLVITDSLGAAVTPTDCRWQVRSSTSAATSVALTTASGITIGTGTVDIVLTAALSAALVAGNYVHEIEIHTSSTEVPPFLSGSLVVDAAVVQ